MDIPVAFAEALVQAVREVAAREILPRYRNVVAMTKDDGSVVTEADFAAQSALVASLARLLPVDVLAEEMPDAEQAAIWERGGRLWCVDPLDGTRNFSSGVPFFAVSVALMEGGRSILGAVYDPIADEAFHAIAGQGCWLNGAPLRVPEAVPPLARAIAEVSLRRDTARLRRELKHRRPYARRLTSGSSTLSWCHLACGRIDAMLHSGQKMWDYAAGALILEEAGGATSTLENPDFWSAPPWRRSAVAARGRALHDEWRQWLLAALDSVD